MTTARMPSPTVKDDVIRVVTWNLEHNGIDRNGDDTRWHTAMHVLADLKPHLLLRQELTRAHMYGARTVWAEAAQLGGMIPFLATATPESANPTGVYVDPRFFDVVEYYEHVTGMWHPVCNPVVRLKGTTTNLSVASFHLCSFDPQQRASEAKRLTTLGKPGMATISGGDGNSFPHTRMETAPMPDWSTITDRSYVAHRTLERDGRLVSDTRPDEILSGQHNGQPPVFRELGHYAATELGQQYNNPLAPTASLWRKDQGPMRRIDRLYATPQVAKALMKLEVINTEDVRHASDHAPVVATFSRAKLHQALSPDLELTA
ncbi:endonuclease/exonuclease/phosphatase family protein [Streptomyces flavofungini]|uniref:endonuclease/exonuclease/phosphatase family protein n=1 Tax=Streptomyces flavofungini TaxID=68200 RepID=UPI0025AEFA17|nr:endonuclease/exonuclease/phosphatase family protein [Streptomyces flavofungini]WJV48889.1 endonuclease/exonuclease/phosphatase family protein [Streptomyces flavofungini]